MSLEHSSGPVGHLPGTEEAIQDAKRVASLPMRMGGLGLRSAVRGADAAYWASWADAMQMIGKKSGRGGHGCGDNGSGGASSGTVPLSCAEQLTAWAAKVSGGDPAGAV